MQNKSGTVNKLYGFILMNGKRDLTEHPLQLHKMKKSNYI